MTHSCETPADTYRVRSASPAGLEPLFSFCPHFDGAVLSTGLMGQDDPPVPAARSRTIRVEHDVASLERVRRATRNVLCCWGVGREQAQDVVTVVSELVANAVVHARPAVVMRICLPSSWSPVVRVEVGDGGPCEGWAPPLGGGEPDEHGRGALIVDSLSVRSGCRRWENGVIHWADVMVGDDGSPDRGDRQRAAELSPGCDAQLPVDAAQMNFDCLGCDEQ